MVETELEPEVVQIFKLINEGHNFLLSGGAGSGKTYSLVQVINHAFDEHPTAKIACITYTNAAVREIAERVDHSNLSVSTIHDFLWDNISQFQVELKKCLVDLLKSGDLKSNLAQEALDYSFFDSVEEGIQYKEYLRIKDGIVSHDEVLILAESMYERYGKLRNILIDKYQFIFVDEYQDTSPKIVKILLKYLQEQKRTNTIGFFGDSMQSIYDDGVGDLQSYIESKIIEEVPKAQNRRNPQSVIDLANQIRTDSITQIPSDDMGAPNMKDGKIVPGKTTFLYSSSKSINQVIKSYETSHFEGWDFANSKETKQLNLTHRLIAEKADFSELYEIYDVDPILKFKSSLVDKIKEDNIEIADDDTFEHVARAVPLKNRQKENKLDLILADPKLNSLFGQLKDLPFTEVRKIYVSKDALLDDKKIDTDAQAKKGSKRDKLIKHLFKIQTNILLYKEKRFNEFIQKTDFPLRFGRDKQTLRDTIESFASNQNKTIGEVIEEADRTGICLMDDNIQSFKRENSYVFSRVSSLPFSEFQNLFFYLEGFTPFTTQHNIKGDQFKNVLVVLDNGGWSKYNFEYLLDDSIYASLKPAKKKSYPDILSRTKKIFYVCCTRAMRNLVVFYQNPSPSIIENAKRIFGESNVYEV
ncbi:MAG: ATP-dependent helicase [Deltaproteobacteria bacterium]|nr:ATP-dependent helicase [Deltaproteobacteria bacterium]